VPSYTDSQNANSNVQPRLHQKRQSDLDAERRVYSPEVQATFSAPQHRSYDDDSDDSGFVKSFEDEMKGIQDFEIIKKTPVEKKRTTDLSRASTEPVKRTQKVSETQQRNSGASPQLMFDLETGKVVDELTGKVYLLQPVEN